MSLPGVGMSVMEISHRSKAFDEIIETAERDLRLLGGVPDNYHVLFLQGGASLQFSMVPMNLLPQGGSADYIVSGAWSEKAVKEAQRVGSVKIAATTKEGNFARVPRQDELKLLGGRGLRPHDVEQHDLRHAVPLPAADRQRAARQRRLVGHLQPADRRRETRPDLRGRAEEPRPVGRHAGDRARRPREEIAGVAGDDAELQRACGEQVAVQHAADVRHLHSRPGAEVDDRAGRADGGGSGQRAQGREALRGDRSHRVLSRSCRAEIRGRG